MGAFVGEVIGTLFLILLGDGVVANVLLAKSKGNNSGWIVITTGWGLAVFVGAYVSAGASGAHLNPAVTIGLAVAGKFSWALVGPYIVAQMIGAFLGATLVWLMYLPHWAETKDQGLKLAVFSTGPAIRNVTTNVIGEVIGTFVLIFGILCIKGVALPGTTDGATVNVSMGALGIIPVALLVFGIGLSLGGPTGYAINPARDLGPRIAHFLLPIAGKGDSDWEYSWIPVVGPIIGAIIAAFFYMVVAPFGF
jgi:glycerol uptake facilitator protein